MSSTSEKSAGPSPFVKACEDTAASQGKKSEQALVKDALSHLPALNPVALPKATLAASPPRTADAQPSHAPLSGANASASLSSSSHPELHGAAAYTLGADDEALLLQELVNITAGAVPFVPSKAPSATSGELDTASGGAAAAAATGNLSSSATSTGPTAASLPAASQSSQGQQQLFTGQAAKADNSRSGAERQSTNSKAAPKIAEAVKQPPLTAPAAAALAGGTTAQSATVSKTAQKKNALTSKEEQEILDAILAAVDGQQSSVSGDLTGLSNEPAASKSPAAQGEGEPAQKQKQQQQERQKREEKEEEALEDEEQDAVDRVLEEAKLLASSTVLCDTQRGELVLHIHEHVALRRQLAELSKTTGAPTCVALADAAAATLTLPATAPSTSRTLAVAVGTTLGAVALFDQRWSLLGLCGSVEANVVNARGAVVSLSLSTAASTKETNEEPTAATGHARGVFILWSLHTLSPLRVIKDECTVPLLRVQHLHRDPSRVFVLESSGAVKLFQFWKVMSKHMLRSTTVTSASAATPISDVDTLPFPSTFYLRHLARLKENLPNGIKSTNSNDNNNSSRSSGIPWLLAPPPLPPASAAAAGVSRTSWATVPDKHLVAAVSNDAVLVYVVEAGLQGAVSGVARHTHPPSSALSNELVRFVAIEQDGAAPRVLLCVSWNTEIELLLLNLQLPESAAGSEGTGSSNSGSRNNYSSHPLAQGVERIALLRLTAPLLQMVPLAGYSMLLLDQNNDAQLMDASVAVMVERHRFAALEYVSFASRLCGMKYNGTVASNQATALLLGKERVYGISLYSWRERLSTLVARRKFAEALDLAKGFAEDVALSMVGLSSNAAQRRRELHQYMEHILLAYLESALKGYEASGKVSSKTGASIDASPSSSPSPASPTSLLDVLQHVASYCSAVDALDVLYGSVARLLQQRGLLSHLLYVLERTMRHGVITYLPEPLIERFMDLFLREDALRAVEVALGVRPPLQTSGNPASAAERAVVGGGDTRVASPTKSSSAATPPAASPLSSADANLSGKDRAELALMCLDSGLPNLLRLAQEHQLLRLSVTIMSYRQKQYVEALAYALQEEEKEEEQEAGKQNSASAYTVRKPSTSASVAVDLVEYTLKDCALLPGADIPAGEQRPAKKALLDYLLQNSESSQPNLLRFLRRRPQHAVRVLLFALSDEGLCSPWSGATEDFCRTQFVSSVYFLLTGGTRTQPRPPKSSGMGDGVLSSPQRVRGGKPLNLFLLSDDELARTPGLRKLCAAELAQRSFPPYEAVHTFLADAALFDELFLADGGDTAAATSEHASVRFDVWVDLVIQDSLFMFQSAETAEQRRALQEQLIQVITPPFIPKERVAVFQPDFTRLRMARCLAALLCKEQRYTEAIRCYIDPVQNRVDPSLQHDVFAMLRGEMQRLQDLRTHTANVAAQQQLSASRRLDSDVYGDGDNGSTAPASPASESAAAGPTRGSELSRHTSSSSFAPPTAANASTSELDDAIKALQRGVMSQVEALVRIDPTALAQFIFDYLPSNHREVMRLLRGSSAAFLDYLDELMAQGDPVVANDINLQNTYIELLCAHAPERVFPHLQEKGSAITYDVQLALRAVRKYRIADASIYLLEKTMMIEEAMSVMLGATRATLIDVREEVITQALEEGDNEKEGGNTKNLDANGKNALEAGVMRKADLKASFASTASGSTGVHNNNSNNVNTVGLASTTAISAAAAQQTTAKKHGAAAGAVSDFLAGASAVPAAADLLRLVGIGKALCQKYRADRLSGHNTGGGSGVGGGGGVAAGHAQSPEYWFRLLDVFMVPRRLLCEVVTQDEQLRSAGRSNNTNNISTNSSSGGGQPSTVDAGVDGTGMPSELEIASRWAVVDGGRSPSPRGGRDGRYATSLPPSESAAYHLPPLTRPLTASQQTVIAALVSVYTQCTSDILRAMMSSLDLAVVVDKVVQDNKDEAFRPFKPVILDMMASLSFDLEASRLCESATESDVMSLGRELYQKLNTGIVTLSDCCALCHLHLSELPPAVTVEATSAAQQASPSLTASAVCVYTCGHAYHTLCCLHAMSPSASPQQQQQQQQEGGCYVCAHQRFSSAQTPHQQQSGGEAAGARRSSVSSSGAASGTAAGLGGGSGGAGGPSASAASAAAFASSAQAATVNVVRMQRRIRQTKVKIDHTEDLYPLLKSYLTWGDSAPSTPARAAAAAAAAVSGSKAPPGASTTAAPLDSGNWVLAPSPRVPAAIGEVAATAASADAATGLNVETLTDAEILELFGSL